MTKSNLRVGLGCILPSCVEKCEITSPQISRDTLYKLSLKLFTLQPASLSVSRNPFVEYAIQYVVAVAYAKFDKERSNALQKLLLRGFHITILGCNEFYSYRNQIEMRRLPLTLDSLALLPPFSSISFNVEESSG